MMGWLTPHAAGRAGHARYRAAQCGLCHHLGAEHGFLTRVAAGPDLVAWKLFLDAVAGHEAPRVDRPCVLTPWARALPVTESGESGALAAAFGLWMGAEKAEDDWRDEGRLLGWLASRALGPASQRARGTLAEAGFPVARVRELLDAQAALEARPEVPLHEAEAPTREIGRLVFGFAARHRPERRPHAEAVGDALASWLFWVDALLDWPADVVQGAANPLVRSLPLGSAVPAVPPPGLRQLALDRAATALDGLHEALLLAVPEARPQRWLAAVLVHGPRQRLARLATLAPSPKATARDLLPPRPPLPDRLQVQARLFWQRLRAHLGAEARTVSIRARAAVAFALAWLLPSTGWAQEWWPDEVLDTGAPVDPFVDGALDTGGLDTGWEAVPMEPEPATACSNNWGFCNFDACCSANCIEPCCEDACSDVTCS